MVKTKLIYIIGSIIIGFISIVGVFFGLTASGVISTEQARVVIATASAEKEYDGTALLCQEWSIADGELKDGHVAHVTITGTATDVGEFDNFASVVITDHVGADVTGDYKLEMQLGKLTVHKRRMTIQSESLEKLYDGAPMQMGTVSVLDDKLVKGHVIHTTTKETSANVGAYQNLFTATILDEKERDVTHNYDLACSYGTLEIKSRKITVETEDINKIYDGVVLTASKGTLSEKTPLLEGHKLVTSPNASIKNVGETDNAVIATILFDGEEVTGNYDIQYKYGKLTVVKRSITIATKDKEKVYDGKELKHEEYYVYEETPLAEGDEIVPTFLGKITNVGTLENTMEAELKCGEERVTDNYEITYVFGSITVTPRPLIITTGSAEKEYDGEPLTCDTWEFVEGTSVVEEEAYVVTVIGSIINAGKTNNEAVISIVNEDNISVISNYSIEPKFGELFVKLRPLTIFTESASKTYDGEPLTCETWDFIDDTSVAPNQTYEVKVIGSLTDVGTETNVANVTITDKNGLDATLNYDITTKYGTLTVNKRPLQIKTGSYERVYDGTPLIYRNWDYVNENMKQADTQTVVVDFVGTITNVGAAKNEAYVSVTDKNGVDVSSNYEIKVTEGTLSVLPRSILIETGGDSKVYDGTPIICDVWDIIDGSLVGEQILVLELRDDQIDVTNGVKNTAKSATVLDKNNEDVTTNYDIQFVCGTLRVTKRPITIETGGGSKVYDGTPIICDVWNIIDGSLADEQTIFVSLKDDQINVTDGVRNTAKSATIVDKYNEDVTTNYDIQFVCGILRVTKRPILIETGSDSKVYDGTPIICDVWDIIDGSLVDEQTLTVLLKDDQIDATSGVGNTAKSATIVDKHNEDVTANYDIQFVCGTLTVTKRPILIETGSDSKVYDGTPIICDVWDIIDGSLADKQAIDVSLKDDQIDVTVGVKNTAEVTITDKYGNIVTSNYDISFACGTLKIDKRPILIETGSYSKVYDGTPITCDVWDIIEGSLAGEQTLIVLLRDDQINVTDGVANTAKSVAILTKYNEDVTKNYDVQFACGTLRVTKRSITIETGSAEKVYDGTPVTSSYWKIIDGSLVDEQTISVALKDNQINVTDGVNNTAEVTIKDKHDAFVTGNYDIRFEYGTLTVTPRPLKIQTGSAEKVYDGTPLTCDETNFLDGTSVVEGQTYVIYITGTITDVGTERNLCTIVIKNKNENVTGNYDIEYVCGELLVTKREIEVVTYDGYKVYDGLPLTNKAVNVIGALADNQQIIVVVDGTITDVGEAENTFTYMIIDADENDVTENYTVKATLGVLVVDYRVIEVLTYGDSKVYDGEALTCDGYDIVSGTIANNQTINPNITGAQINVGTGKNTAEPIIFGQSNTDVTSNYKITVIPGELIVTPRPLEIQTGSAEKYYDGTPLDCKEFDYLNGTSLAKDQKIQVIYHASLTNTDTISNTADVIITDKDNVVVTDNYKIEISNGTLTVLKRIIRISTNSDYKVYDGTPLMKDGYTLLVNPETASEGEKLAPNQVLDVQVWGSITDVGTIKNYAEVRIFMGKEDVTSNYVVEVREGTLEVTKRILTIKTENANRVYDGLPVANEKYTCIGGLVEGHELEINFLNSTNVDVGEYKNIISVCVKDGETEKTGNYDIQTFAGTLTITPREITVRSGSAEKVYDGTPLTCEDKKVVSINNVLNGHTLEAVTSGEQLSVGSSKNEFGQIRVMYTNEQGQYVEITRNYKIIEQYGTLTVKAPDTNGPGDGDGNNDGVAPPSGDLKNGDNFADELVCLEVYSETSGPAYLRYASYSNYEGTEWAPGEEYNLLLDDTYSYNYLFSIALEKAQAKSYAMEIKDYTNAYYLPYYTQLGVAGYQIQTSDVVYYGQDSSHYSLYYYVYDFASLGLGGLYGVNLGSYTALAAVYQEFVETHYKSMPINTRNFFDGLIAEQGFDKNDPNIISKVAKYIQGAAKYNLEYDEALDDEADIAVEFLRKYKEGVCRHYASAATLLYRALGFPARFVTGFLANTKANKWTEVKGKQAHAWVEVYINGYGWIQVEVTGSGDGEGNGGGGDEQGSSALAIEITPVKVAVQSNGSNYAEAKNEVTGGKVFNELLALGYRYEAEISGRRETYGKGKSTIEEFKLYSPANTLIYHYLGGERLVNTENLEIVFKSGVVHLYIETLTFTSASYSKTYDGTLLIPENNYSWTGSLQSGHSIAEVVFTGKQLNAGKTSNAFTVKIVNEDGQDITSWYNVVKKMGTLTVLYRSIEVTAGTHYFTYNGTEQRYNFYEITAGQGLAENQSLTLSMMEDCYIQDYGIVANVINVSTISIKDEAGQDVTSNYTIDTVDGLLIMVN